MVRTQDELNEIIKQYIEIVTKCFYVKKIILFGSYAHGKPHKDSDIDLAVVSPDFEYIPYEMSGKILFRIARFVDTSIEPVPVDEEEYLTHPLGSLAYELAKTGKVVYSSN